MSVYINKSIKKPIITPTKYIIDNGLDIDSDINGETVLTYMYLFREKKTNIFKYLVERVLMLINLIIKVIHH